MKTVILILAVLLTSCATLEASHPVAGSDYAAAKAQCEAKADAQIARDPLVWPYKVTMCLRDLGWRYHRPSGS